MQSHGYSETSSAFNVEDDRSIPAREPAGLLAGVLVFVAALLAILAALVLQPETINELMWENGPIENATVIWYGGALIAVWLIAHPDFDRTSAAATSIILFACIAREISLRRRLLSAAGYDDDPAVFDMTAWPNLLACVVVIMLLLAAAWLLWRYGRTARNEVQRGRPYALTLEAAFLCLVASQLMERVQKMDIQLGLSMSARARATALSLEEVLEMLLPVLIVIAAVQVGLRASSRRQPHRQSWRGP